MRNRARISKMSDVDKVLGFIDSFYSNASQRPKMYFTSPEAFEDTVSVLERLRDLLVNRLPETQLDTYSNYLFRKGFGNFSFSSSYKQSQANNYTEDEFYKAYSEFLMEYLKNGRGQ